MGSLAFLILLAVFGAILYWYVTNLDKEADGSHGFLAVGEESTRLKEKKAGPKYKTGAAKIRARLADIREDKKNTS